MSVTWVTPAGDLGTYPERQIVNIPISATSDTGDITYSVISGSLPSGLRIINSLIVGSPVEVTKFTESRFVIRASDGTDTKDRTFKISIDGSDLPEWITPEGFLNVGNGDSYFVLDNAPVDFQLEVVDPDVVAGDSLEFYLLPNSGQLPPGLSLSRSGKISGFTDPVFSIVFNNDNTGSFDSEGFDTVSLDIGNLNTNGYDSYLFDTQDFDYTETSRVPRKLSRAYAFSVAVSDGENVVSRLFKIYVVTEEFLAADNNIVQVDTNLFQADNTRDRLPIWITDSYLGRWRANNYITIPLDVYDPISLRGDVTYLLEPANPDGSSSTLPPGMTIDSVTGDISGRVPYQSAVTKTYQFTVQAVNIDASVNTNYTLVGTWDSTTTYTTTQAVRYLDLIYICIQNHRNIPPGTDDSFWIPSFATASRTFTIDVIGEIESAITWQTDSDLGNIKPNRPSTLNVYAETNVYGGRLSYTLVNGSLPPGLEFLPTGDIQGKVKQFADDEGLGLTRFFDDDSSLLDSTGSRTFDTTFDGGNTSFDRKFDFTIEAADYAGFAKVNRSFSITVDTDSDKTFANLYTRALQSKEKRLEWFNFITDATIFDPEDLYRYGDTNFSVQTDLRVLIYAGIESLEAVNYVQAMSRNHYRKRFRFGEVKKAVAKNPSTQETLYEVVYVDVIDEFEKNGKSISNEIQLKDDIESKVLVSYDAITIDSDTPFVSDSDHQRIFPNSIKNMRDRFREIGERDRTYLPLWMRSIQDSATFELGYTKALVLCYANPGRADSIMARIKANGFDFKNIDFVADRYIIDVIDGEFKDKYLAFPQRGEKLP